LAGAEQPGAQDRGQADRPGADHSDDVAGLHRAVEDTHFVAGGQDVGQHEQVFVADPVRRPVGGVLREGNPHILGLGAVDQVAEHPAASGAALTVAAFAAEPATRAGGDAGDEHVVTGMQVLDAAPGFDHGADGLVAEDPPGLDLRDISLEDCRSVPQMVTASTRTMASRSSMISGSVTCFQAFWPGPP
jgi:hypothetical protein